MGQVTCSNLEYECCEEYIHRKQTLMRRLTALFEFSFVFLFFPGFAVSHILVTRGARGGTSRDHQACVKATWHGIYCAWVPTGRVKRLAVGNKEKWAFL